MTVCGILTACCHSWRFSNVKNNLHRLCHPEQGRRICKHPRVCIQILHFVIDFSPFGRRPLVRQSSSKPLYCFSLRNSQNDKRVKHVVIFISFKPCTKE